MYPPPQRTIKLGDDYGVGFLQLSSGLDFEGDEVDYTFTFFKPIRKVSLKDGEMYEETIGHKKEFSNTYSSSLTELETWIVELEKLVEEIKDDFAQDKVKRNERLAKRKKDGVTDVSDNLITLDELEEEVALGG